MTGNTRQRRIDTLSQAARRKSETKTKAAEAAIRTLVKHGEPVTFQAVQREAGVSHAFLYGNADPPRPDRTAPRPGPPETAAARRDHKRQHDHPGAYQPDHSPQETAP